VTSGVSSVPAKKRRSRLSTRDGLRRGSLRSATARTTWAHLAGDAVGAVNAMHIMPVGLEWFGDALKTKASCDWVGPQSTQTPTTGPVRPPRDHANRQNRLAASRSHG
jgi:hypothetical protein